MCYPGTALLVAVVGHRLSDRIDRADDMRVLGQVDEIVALEPRFLSPSLDIDLAVGSIEQMAPCT